MSCLVSYMNVTFTILNGNRHTLWNVKSFNITETGAEVKFSDRPDGLVQGRIEKIKILH